MADNQADARQMLVSVRDLKVTVLKAGSQEQEIIPSGTSFKITATDGKSFVEAKMDDGRSCRIPVVKDADAWEWKINGVSEYECFEIRATAIPLALDGGLS